MASMAPGWRRFARDPLLIVLIGGLLVLWGGYALARALAPDDALAAYRNDVWWPHRPYLTVAQPGVAIMVFGHVMVTFVGGLVLSMLAVALAAGVRRLGGPDLRSRVVAPLWIALLLYGFLLLRGVPARVTVVDPDARTLTTRSLGRFSFWPGEATVIRGAELEGLVTRVTRYADWRTDSDWVLQVHAVTRDGRTRLLGLRPCPAGPDACLDAGDRGMTELLAMLGRGAPAIETGERGRVRAYRPRP